MMNCNKCGKSKEATKETSAINPICTCENYTFGGMAGWICPRCGRGNSPFTHTCSCIPPPPFNVTC